MMHPSPAGKRSRKRVVISLLASAYLIVGSPVIAVTWACTGSAPGHPNVGESQRRSADDGVSSRREGAHKSVSDNHGDCKHHNFGEHNGYDCRDGSSPDASPPVTTAPTVPAPPVPAPPAPAPPSGGILT
jgi:hypothetical protein